MRYSLALAGLLALAQAAGGQTRYLGIGAELGLLEPLGTWADRFGRLNVGAARVEWAPGRHWSYALRAEILFGDRVEVDPLAALRAPAGPIYGEDGFGDAGFSSVALRARGYRFAALVGYERPLGGPRWRLYAAAGPHFLLHEIRIQDDPELSTPQVGGPRRSGYDRRAGGFGGAFEVGPRFVPPGDRYVLFAAASVAFTASAALRATQFDLGDADYHDGADADFGIRAGVVLGLLRGLGGGPAADDTYY